MGFIFRPRKNAVGNMESIMYSCRGDTWIDEQVYSEPFLAEFAWDGIVPHNYGMLQTHVFFLLPSPFPHLQLATIVHITQASKEAEAGRQSFSASMSSCMKGALGLQSLKNDHRKQMSCTMITQRGESFV